MVGSYGSKLDPSIYKGHHVKVQALITNHLISKRWREIYSDYLAYNLPQDKGDKSDPILLQKYLTNMTAKMGKYAGDRSFHAILCDNSPTTMHFMFPFHHNTAGCT